MRRASRTSNIKRLLKYRIAEAILGDDRYDVSGKRYLKRIPPNHDRLYFLSVFYTGPQILHFSIDAERASDSHHDFDAAAAKQIRQLFPTIPSLPEALAEYFVTHDDSDFTSLLSRNRILCKSFHGHD